jgi:type II secretory ATPase GspE/PulE/Tfp pilus assembly ATPase PilB-like protein/CheY-like chemotaxis protein
MGQELRDAWLLPTLESLLTREELAKVSAALDGSYWQAAIASGVIDEASLLDALATRNRMRVAELSALSPSLREHLPESLARKYMVLPVLANDEVLEVATADPTDLDCERALEFATGRSVRFLLASPMRIADALDEMYRPENAIEKILENVTEKYDVQAVAVSDAVEDIALLGEKAGERPVIRLVDYIVAEAISARASDVHVEPEEQTIAIRYRIDGVLRQTMELPRAAGGPLVSRVKIMSGLDIADRLRPQDGRARVTVNGKPVDLRISTLPSAHGEKVVIRILDQKTNALSLDNLGLDAEDAERLEKLLGVREGIILVTGPTGSGKTTTLYSALKKIKERDVNIVTVEDPVEYRLPGIVQVQVNEKAGLTFASALRSILRQDPDVVLVGEIRDRETAGIAVQASLTGHLVFSTLHTIDAASSITRLVDIGVEPYKIAAALKGVIAQRLVRRLCRTCSEVDDSPVSERLREWIPDGATLYRAVGCPECASTGYRGRSAITEILTGTAAIERCVAEGGAADQIAAVAREAGMRTLFESGLSQVLAGATSLDELLRVAEVPAEGRARPRAGRSERSRGAGRNGDGRVQAPAEFPAPEAPPARMREASTLFASDAFKLLDEESVLPDDVALRVLLADDDPAVRSAIRQALEEEGVEVEECDSGAAALEVADRDAPDLLVLDLEMPGVDAFEALTRLRARPATRELPVVVLVPNDDEDTEIRAFSLGADDVLTKPIRARALAARLLAHLRRLGAADGYGGLPPSDLLRRRDGAAA